MNLAPIVLFVYNRPWHTQQTVEALQKNHLASDSDLFIYSDGFKSESDKPKVLEVREYIRNIDGFKSVTIKESPVNKGLTDSIIDGVTEIVNKYGRIIVLEDDIVTSPFFLQYMNDALELYKDETKVMHISGYWFPVKDTESLPTTFFYAPASCWGWGTWKRAWEKLEVNCCKLEVEILKIPNGKYHFNIENGVNFFKQLEDNIQNKIKTWGIKWYASVFINQGLSLHPNISFVNNIGHDNSGTFCNKSNEYNWETLSGYLPVYLVPVEESKDARKKIKHLFKENHYLSLKSHILNFISKINFNHKIH